MCVQMFHVKHPVQVGRDAMVQAGRNAVVRLQTSRRIGRNSGSESERESGKREPDSESEHEPKVRHSNLEGEREPKERHFGSQSRV